MGYFLEVPASKGKAQLITEGKVMMMTTGNASDPLDKFARETKEAHLVLRELGSQFFAVRAAGARADRPRDHLRKETIMEKNTELAYKTLDYIREHPEEWSQDSFFCGTTACFAGRAIMIALEKGNEADVRAWMTDKYGSSRDSQWLARQLLGWTYEEAHHVFYRFTSDFTELERAVKEVLNGEVG
jgi:hypothetical protein